MWLLFVFSLIIFIVSIYLIIQSNKKIEINKENQIKNEILLKEKEKLEEEIKTKTEEMQKVSSQVAETCQQASISAQEFEDQIKKSMNIYLLNLEDKYNEYEDEYDNNIDLLKKSYDNAQDNLIKEYEVEKEKLNKIKATRIAAQEAILKEKEIKENKSFYCLTPSQEDLDDVNALERIKPKLHQPRILCMLIWSTYFQKPMTALCNNVLGPEKITGIYKITNQETNECYIGQAVDVATRWKDHAKCGLGIDTPASNKLYKAMQEYGLQSFSFELLEKCDKTLLNEKESYYIELYQSYEYGYNSNKGIKKS